MIRLQELIRTHWSLLAITLVAASLRFWDLDRVGFNSDEAVYAGQAAALAGDPSKAQFFSVFRAHPLLLQFMISLVYRFGISEFGGRAVVAGLGTLTVSVVYALGNLLFSKKAALLSSIMLAFLPYHILVSRQVLLDVAMGFFFALTMIFVAMYVKTGDVLWAYAFGASAALTVLSKEVGILILPVIIIFLKTQNVLRVKPFLMATLAFLLTLAPFPLSLLVGGGTGKATFIVTWQLSRPANHTWLFYPVALFPYFDVVAILAVAGLVIALFRRTSSDALLFLWFAIPYLFFQFWPVKGFHYVIPVVPALCLFAGRFFDLPLGRITGNLLKPIEVLRTQRLFSVFLIFLAASSLFLTYTSGFVQAQQARPLAGLSGLQGGRELGNWIKQSVPEGAVFLTIGPTMANLIQFYGDREAFGLSVSPNPLRRNPSYTPVRNPDFEILTGRIHYLVWDIYSSTQSTYFGDRLMGFAAKYDAQLAFTVSIESNAADGTPIQTEIITVYRVFGRAAM